MNDKTTYHLQNSVEYVLEIRVTESRTIGDHSLNITTSINGEKKRCRKNFEAHANRTGLDYLDAAIDIVVSIIKNRVGISTDTYDRQLHQIAAELVDESDSYNPSAAILYWHRFAYLYN